MIAALRHVVAARLGLHRAGRQQSGTALPCEVPRPMSQHDGPGVQDIGPAIERGNGVLTPEALAFVAELQRRFGARRDELLC
jgi:hypothetical protein